MTDEEFLKLARERGASFYVPVNFVHERFLALCREIERRTLKRAAEKCAEIDGGENEFSRAIRAMIKEKG